MLSESINTMRFI